jgi:hypothetical protein
VLTSFSEEMKTQQSIIISETTVDRLRCLIREVTDHFVFKQLVKKDNEPFGTSIKNALKLKDADDWGTLCSSLDLIQDTHLAICSFNEHLKLSKKKKDLGTDYLLLYGLLTAAYLRLDAISRLLEILNIHNSKKEIEALKKHDLILLRHKVAAHTSAVIIDDGSPPLSFQIHRFSIGTNSVSYNDSRGKIDILELSEIISDFSITTADYLKRICHKFISTVFKGQPTHKATYMLKLNQI